MALKEYLIYAVCEFSIMFILSTFCKVSIPSVNVSFFASVQNTRIYLLNDTG